MGFEKVEKFATLLSFLPIDAEQIELFDTSENHVYIRLKDEEGIYMNSLVQLPSVSNEEIAYYANKFIEEDIQNREQIIFEHYLLREIMIQKRQIQKMRSFPLCQMQQKLTLKLLHKVLWLKNLISSFKK